MLHNLFWFFKNITITTWANTIDILLSRQLIGLSIIVCPHIMKSGTRYPLTTKNRKEGGGFVQAGTIFSA